MDLVHQLTCGQISGFFGGRTDPWLLQFQMSYGRPAGWLWRQHLKWRMEKPWENFWRVRLDRWTELQVCKTQMGFAIGMFWMDFMVCSKGWDGTIPSESIASGAGGVGGWPFGYCHRPLQTQVSSYHWSEGPEEFLVGLCLAPWYFCVYVYVSKVLN